MENDCPERVGGRQRRNPRLSEFSNQGETVRMNLPNHTFLKREQLKRHHAFNGVDYIHIRIDEIRRVCGAFLKFCDNIGFVHAII